MEKEILKSLRDLLKKSHQPVSEIEMTSGNYDNGKLIKEEIPTITTNFCEIGLLNENICYFTYILNSSSFSEKLFDLVKDQQGIHIYGFKNFLEDYYPVKDFSFDELVKKINKEKYFQVQFNFNLKKLGPEIIFQKYLELKDTFEKSNTEVVNQIKVKLT